MILNTGARTDIAQYYSEWLFKRFEEGFAYTRNPLFPNKVTKYELSPDKIDLVLFCSKNYKHILPRLREITDKYRTYFHYTITAYGRDIEPYVPSIDNSIQTLINLANMVGKQRLTWRYDPILLTEKYTIDIHAKTFEYIASRVAPYINNCVFSFVEMYKKLEKNMPEIIPYTENDKEIIAKILGDTAKKYNIIIQTCGTNGDFSRYGIKNSGCATLELLGKANGCEFKDIKHKGMREGCHCIESRDIGAYDTCLNGCKYCYANQNPQKAWEMNKLHNPNSPLLLGEIMNTDIIIQGNQKSFLKPSIEQITFFDEI